MTRASRRAALAGQLRATAFAGPVGGAPARIGAEVELIPVDAVSGRVTPVATRLLPLLRAHGEEHGWRQRESLKGAPRFDLAGGGSVTLEPGGQVEYATPPYATPRALLDDLDAVLPPLSDAAAAQGITLLSAGVDPRNPIDTVPLQIESDRYRAMDAYFATIGPAGAVMMRQTASVQVNVDAASDPLATWCVLNAAAPHLTAVFANSPHYAGADTGHASYRARLWRLLDPARTGMLRCRADAAEEYADFALRAPVIARRTARGAYLSLDQWLEAGCADPGLIDEHLSTLFPEIRPKGWFEVRSIDAIPLEWLPAAILLVGGITLDGAALDVAAQLLGSPDAGLLVCGGTLGLRDARIAPVAVHLVDAALAACERKGRDFCSAGQLSRAAAFFDRYTRRGRTLADDSRI